MSVCTQIQNLNSLCKSLRLSIYLCVPKDPKMIRGVNDQVIFQTGFDKNFQWTDKLREFSFLDKKKKLNLKKKTLAVYIILPFNNLEPCFPRIYIFQFPVLNFPVQISLLSFHTLWVDNYNVYYVVFGGIVNSSCTQFHCWTCWRQSFVEYTHLWTIRGHLSFSILNTEVIKLG